MRAFYFIPWSLLFIGCSVTSFDRLPAGYEVPKSARGPRVSLRSFSVVETQDFDRSSERLGSYRKTTWKEAKGFRDIAWRVSELLAERGFETTYQPLEPADILVFGVVSEVRDSTESRWPLLAGSIQTATLFIFPMYAEASYEAELTLEVRDRAENVLVQRKTTVEFPTWSLYPMGLSGPGIDSVAEATVPVVTSALEEAIAGHAL